MTGARGLLTKEAAEVQRLLEVPLPVYLEDDLEGLGSCAVCGKKGSFGRCSKCGCQETQAKLSMKYRYVQIARHDKQQAT